jgi:hypothetical protein
MPNGGIIVMYMYRLLFIAPLLALVTVIILNVLAEGINVRTDKAGMQEALPEASIARSMEKGYAVEDTDILNDVLPYVVGVSVASIVLIILKNR